MDLHDALARLALLVVESGPERKLWQAARMKDAASVIDWIGFDSRLGRLLAGVRASLL